MRIVVNFDLRFIVTVSKYYDYDFECFLFVFEKRMIRHLYYEANNISYYYSYNDTSNTFTAI